MFYLFLISMGIVTYIYLGYPLLLFIISRLFPKNNIISHSFLPTVTVLVSAYNEEDVIEKKINNLLELKYPKDLIRFIVCSDCSDDETDEIVLKYKDRNITLVRQGERLGKTACLNKAIKQVDSEIIVFSDANSMYEDDAVKKLVRNFADQKIGYVVGMQLYEEKASEKSREVSYWAYEINLKKWESKIGSVVGGDGAIYAIRKELFEDLEPGDINDFLNPLQIISKGFRGIFEPEAICFEEPSESVDLETKRKVRIISRSWHALFKIPKILNPFTYGFFSIQLISHKLLRWLAPFFIIITFFTNLFLLGYDLFFVIFLLQCLFYLLAFVPYIFKSTNKYAFFSIPFYFCAVNIASFKGVFKGIIGNISGTWSPAR